MARILSISYDPHLLMSRELLLQQMGYEVISAEGFSQAYEHCETRNGHFDLIVLGHSIPHDDKHEIMRRLTKACDCPVVALLRANEPPLEGAAASVQSLNPPAFIAAVRTVLQNRMQQDAEPEVTR